MNDLQISKALALAIGWDKKKVFCYKRKQIMVNTDFGFQDFDYRDWNVIGPIAEKYDCFPKHSLNCDIQKNGWASPPNNWADTPQKAIAMAVIGTKK
jgi:hypothetical protein